MSMIYHFLTTVFPHYIWYEQTNALCKVCPPRALEALLPERRTPMLSHFFFLKKWLFCALFYRRFSKKVTYVAFCPKCHHRSALHAGATEDNTKEYSSLRELWRLSEYVVEDKENISALVTVPSYSSLGRLVEVADCESCPALHLFWELRSDTVSGAATPVTGPSREGGLYLCALSVALCQRASSMDAWTLPGSS